MAQVEKTLLIVAVHSELVTWLASKLKPGEALQDIAGEYLQAGAECKRTHKKKEARL